MVANDSVEIKDVEGNVYDLKMFNGRQIKWTRRVDGGILVAVKSENSAANVVLLFEDVEFYQTHRQERTNNAGSS